MKDNRLILLNGHPVVAGLKEERFQNPPALICKGGLARVLWIKLSSPRNVPRFKKLKGLS